LAGLVDRVTFHNPENGFCVLRVKARGQRDLITVLGHAAMISAGEFVQASGTWINDRTHGVQFRASFLKATAPTTVEGIERYLGSGMIRGIGPVYAKKLVRTFGEAVFDVIEHEPPRLRQVTGIGPKRANRIIAGWAEQKVIREIMLFLHSNGVGTSRAVRIYKIGAVKPEAARHLSDAAAAVGRVHRVHAIGAKLMHLSSVATVIDDADQQFDAVTLHGLQLFRPAPCDRWRHGICACSM
jgi:exodeoxyribonuclease V alpha subunit